MLEELKEQVYRANLFLYEKRLVVLTWGNASAIDREKGLVVIKPSGVPYASLTSQDMVVTDLDGKVIEGKLRPSVDLMTHLVLYRSFPEVNGVVHDHSSYATAFAQAKKEIAPFGTTQADSFYGPIPCTRELVKEEVEKDYEKNTGLAIVERFRGLDSTAVPGCLVASHGVFTWDKDAMKAAENALILEECAKMAYLTETIDPSIKPIDRFLLDEHYLRKHGKNPTYGQGDKK